jgi:hypothetical protein
MMPFITLSTGRTITVIKVLFNAYDENYWKYIEIVKTIQNE